MQANARSHLPPGVVAETGGFYAGRCDRPFSGMAVHMAYGLGWAFRVDSAVDPVPRTRRFPTSIPWIRDVRRLRPGHRLMEWLTPHRPARVTPWTTVAFSLLHLAAILALFKAGAAFCDSYNIDIDGIVVFAATFLAVLGLGAPMFGYLWARIFVSFRNWLFHTRRKHCCQTCGYNLTGNTSGRCPECGEAP